MKRQLGRYTFNLVAEINLDRAVTGQVLEYSYELPANVRLNRYAKGPFCKFSFLQNLPLAGVYAITVGENVAYIGECQQLSDRFGPNGYGCIAARNCHRDGQATNCKINARILQAAKTGNSVGVWFFETNERHSLEQELIRELNPPWNGRRGSAVFATNIKQRRSLAAPAREDFREALAKELLDAENSGLSFVRIEAGELHRKLGGYPGTNHRMPVCCDVMRAMMQPRDRIVAGPRSGRGARLTIEYCLPRR